MVMESAMNEQEFSDAPTALDALVEYMRKPRCSQVPVARRKLAQLRLRGFVVNGVAVYNPRTGERGVVDDGGFVGWMSKESNP